MKNKKVFVTYSWDSEEHQGWTMMLTNTLREKDGIDATLDVYEIEGQTKNLNRMMVENIHTYDYVVVVLTEGYANKANNELGGVGYESTMLMDIIKDPSERNKVIFLNRHSGDYSATIPDFARGYTFIDVSDSNLEKGYEELVRKIKEAPKFIKPKLGRGRELEQKDVGTFSFGGVEIPNLTPVTPITKEEFIKETFKMMLDIFRDCFEAIKSKNSNFEYEIKDNGDHTNIRISLEKNIVKSMNYWMGSFGMRQGAEESILYQNSNMSFGSSFSPNSMNGSLNVEIGRDGKLFLKNSFGFYGSNGATREEIIEELLKNEFVEPLKQFHNSNLIQRW